MWGLCWRGRCSGHVVSLHKGAGGVVGAHWYVACKAWGTVCRGLDSAQGLCAGHWERALGGLAAGGPGGRACRVSVCGRGRGRVASAGWGTGKAAQGGGREVWVVIVLAGCKKSNFSHLFQKVVCLATPLKRVLCTRLKPEHRFWYVRGLRGIAYVNRYSK